MATTKTAAKPAPKKTSTKPVKNANTKKEFAEENEFQDFFVDELKDIYWAEKHLYKAL
ncbi:MAG: ferritin-like domain-containing protein, partial [Pedobacter sp.]